ncbi:MAG: PBP1A family penicillin-binding protein [candidate division KSB1 bacterium]|nr:PBP1A family penicillin-binding protein [candidate division KSB1 bacterium]
MKRTAKILLIGSGLIALAAIIYALLRLPQLPDDLNRIALGRPTKIYDDDGRLIRIMANRQIVPLSQISPYMIQAVLALEDRDFYRHHGISKTGMARALLANLRFRRVAQGGSTITQQLAKNLFFSFERSMVRKLQELFITLQIEQQFTKDQILEAYLNQIDFGSGVYGVEPAAQIYFSKHADELTLAEAAMLAGIPRWPARYNPYKNPEVAKERQQFVLKRMLEAGSITQEQYDTALRQKLRFRQLFEAGEYAEYFIDAVINEASEQFGKAAVLYGGLDIFTTLNSDYQAAAVEAITLGLQELDELLGLPPYKSAKWSERSNYPQAALAAIDPRTGAVKALVGGRDFRSAPFNRALAANRLPGSAFKPFTFTAAIDRGIISPETVLVDEPVQFRIYNQIWEPKNYDQQYLGPMTAKMALAKSRNVIAAQIIEKVGPETVIKYAKEMGITSPLEPNLSLALGSSGVSPLEMASGYATLAAEGIYRKPFLIRKINAPQKLLYENEYRSKRALDQQTSYIMIDMLTGVVEFGTAASIRTAGIDRPCAGKTGTTNDFRDAWFVGFTPELVAAVWVGFDDNRSMRTPTGRGITGAYGALPIWIRFIQRALAGKVYQEFPIPPGIEFRWVDPYTGQETDAATGMRIAVRSTQ